MKNFVLILILISMIIFSGCGVSNPIAPDVDTSSIHDTLSKSPMTKPQPSPGHPDGCGCK